MSEKNFSSFGDLETLIAEIVSKISGKVDKVTGKGLSTNDYTTADKNKVDALKSASTKDVPSSGNASTSQVVMGNDTRLTNARPASDVSAWAKASTKPSYTASEVGAIATSAKGAANGVAELDSAGKVPSSQLPSYVDDVLEYSSMSAFPATGETGKIYVAKDTNKTYRWSGTAYVEISPSLALGETSSTAYRGDRGKTAYDHSQLRSGNPHNVTKSEVGLGNVPNVSTNDQTPTFTQASSRANIVSGEKLSVIFGKVMKFFSDLGTAAFTDSDSYRPSLLKRYQNSNTNARWYKLFSVSYSSYNYLSFRVIVKHGYWPLTEALVSIRYTPDGVLSDSSCVRIIPSSTTTEVVRVYKINNTTIGFAAFNNGGSSDLGFEILDVTSENNLIPISSFVVENPFVLLDAAPDKFGVHTYLTGHLSTLIDDSTHRTVTDTEKSTWNGKQAAISNIGIAEIKTGTATNQRSVQASVLNPAIKMYCPHYATCTSQAANQKKAVVVADTNFQLYTGCIIAVKFDADNTYSPTAAAPAMFNVNSTGDKEVRGNSVNAAITGTTATNIFGRGNRIISYQYDGTYWVKIGQSWDDNNTYSPQSLGFGYGTCDTAAATAAKVVTLSGYGLVNNGIVSVKFTYDVPASATMNVNSKGAKSIYYHGAAITAGIIKAGDIATFMYYNNIYHLISVDSDHPIEITWDAWNALSSAQRAGKHYIITDVPDATGSLDCELMDLLWTNPSPSAEFGMQSVVVNLSDYDFVLMDTIIYSSNESFTSICRVPKDGSGVRSRFINAWWDTSSNAVRNQQREYYVYDSRILFTDAKSSGGIADSDLVPYHIYGIKRSLSFDFSAIAHDVKTDAANCMLSDDVTSVEDKIGNIFFVEKTVSNVSVSSAWGSLYLAQVAVDISGLGLTNAPDVVSVEFSTSGGDIAFCVAANITKNNITVFMLRGVTGTVSGKIMIMLKSNG